MIYLLLFMIITDSLLYRSCTPAGSSMLLDETAHIRSTLTINATLMLDLKNTHFWRYSDQNLELVARGKLIDLLGRL